MDETVERSDREQLGNGDTPLETLDALIDAYLPRVTARLWATCCWPESMAGGWRVGDFRYVIFSVEPDGASLYVQFWSEPGEDVMMEVCSGAWNPGAVEYVGRTERGKLERLGLAVEEPADNFGKAVTIASPADAERYAREVLTILFDVFGYRGQWPFEVEREQGARWEMAATYESLTPEDFGKLAAEVGYDAAIVDAEGTPAAVLTKGRRRSAAFFVAPVPKSNLFSGILLRASLAEPQRVDDARLNDITCELLEARVARDTEGDLMIEHVMRLHGGVTAEWIMHGLGQWDGQVRTAERLVRRSSRRKAPARKKRVTTH
jgi:hypothetical protein